MRITAEAKQETRRRILVSARKLFVKNGFDQATTRQVAAAAGIATGTLFNYFPSKEALAMSLLSEALETAPKDHLARRRGHESLEEDLFGHIAAGLRRLAPFRSFAADVLDVTMTPLAMLRDGEPDAAARFRGRHLEVVGELLADHGVRTPSNVAMHLYWTLYLGVLAFWSRDGSPKQEETLALLDQSLRLFVGALKEKSHAPDHRRAR